MTQDGREGERVSQAGRLSHLLAGLDGFFSVEVTDHGVLVRWKGRVPDELPRLVVESGLTPDLVTVVPSEHSRAQSLQEQEAVRRVLDGLAWVCIAPCVDGRTVEVEMLDDDGVAEAQRRLARRRSTFVHAVSGPGSGPLLRPASTRGCQGRRRASSARA